MAGFDDDLRFAHVLADAADDITMRRFRARDLTVQSKPDLTPVTDADLATEESLRGVLRRARPRDAMLGEEFGRTGVSPRCWIIDPIDGTKNFVRGVPVWATLIGLMADGEVTVGVASAPALGSRTLRCPTPTSRRGSRPAGSTRSSGWPDRCGGPGPTATSGRTCLSPRER